MLGLNRRRVMGGKALPYDAEIEYLESSGTQYIDTGIVPNIKTDFYIRGANTGKGFFFGCRNYVGSKTFGIWRDIIYYGSAYNKIGYDYNSFFDFILTQNSVSVGSVKYSISRTAFDMDTTILLFGWNNRGSVGNACKISTAQFSENGVLKCDFIPVRIGTTGYMYDKVSGQLFGNSGTGDFILGADK